MIPPVIEWRARTVRLLDQRVLPNRVRFVQCRDVAALCDAIGSLAVRGAPALGVAGGYGVALAAHNMRSKRDVRAAARRLVRTRPTAVNLASGVTCVLDAFERGGAPAALAAADRLKAETCACSEAISLRGVALVPQDARILTHCNTGALACLGYGSALGVVRAAAEAGRRPRVLADETRPLLQGARLTMWELAQLGIPAAVIPDGAAPALISRGEVDLVIVGADRIAANGDVANKIGTYGVALAARAHDIPFYVAAPTSTVDLETGSGDDIPIEDRDPEEVTHVGGRRVTPAGAAARNPAFDVTPARLVTALVTEVGIARPPYRRSLPAHVRRGNEVGVTPGR